MGMYVHMRTMPEISQTHFPKLWDARMMNFFIFHTVLLIGCPILMLHIPDDGTKAAFECLWRHVPSGWLECRRESFLGLSMKYRQGWRRG